MRIGPLLENRAGDLRFLGDCRKLGSWGSPVSMRFLETDHATGPAPRRSSAGRYRSSVFRSFLQGFCYRLLP